MEAFPGRVHVTFLEEVSFSHFRLLRVPIEGEGRAKGEGGGEGEGEGKGEGGGEGEMA
jgi:hypothetical protein